MVNVSLTLEPIDTPDAEMRIRAAWRILAEMVLEIMSAEEGGGSQEIEGSPIPEMVASSHN